MSGSDSELAEQFVRGRHVNWLGVARTMIASLILVVSAGIIWTFEAIMSLPARFVTGVTEWTAQLASKPWNWGARHFEVAWKTVGLEFPIAGPFDFAIAVLVIAATFWVIGYLVRHVVLGVFG